MSEIRKFVQKKFRDWENIKNLNELVGKNIVVTAVEIDTTGKFGDRVIVTLDDDKQYVSGATVLIKQLKAEGDVGLPLMTRIETRTSESGNEYYVLAEPIE